MWQIYHKYYHYDKASFMDRIHKNNYYSFYIHNDIMVGFTGLRINDFKFEGKNTFLIYFGQIIILNEFRGKSLIPVTGFKLFLKFWRSFLFSKTYFWADTLCYKPYLVFAKTLEVCYPSYKQITPAPIKRLIDHIGETHYGETYEQATGTVIKDKKLVKDPASIIRSGDTVDPDVRFFAQANPHHEEGRGLITLGPATRRNMIKIMNRFLKKVLEPIQPLQPVLRLIHRVRAKQKQRYFF